MKRLLVPGAAFASATLGAQPLDVARGGQAPPSWIVIESIDQPTED